MSKVIYQPSGKAREYSPWACNLYVGCSNDCSYCFNKRGVLSKVAGGPVAKLKSGIKDEDQAFDIFLSELKRYKDRIIRDGGLMFSFTTDPCLPETVHLTMKCVAAAAEMHVPCSILTKCAEWTNEEYLVKGLLGFCKDYVAVGFTLTGRDDLERGASKNAERVLAMRSLHDEGYRTFASIEPVINLDRSLEMIRQSTDCCDHYKIGLLSGDEKTGDRYDIAGRLEEFIYEVDELLTREKKTVYWKKSVTQVIGHEISDPCCVDKTFNIFKQTTTDKTP